MLVEKSTHPDWLSNAFLVARRRRAGGVRRLRRRRRAADRGGRAVGSDAGRDPPHPRAPRPRRERGRARAPVLDSGARRARRVEVGRPAACRRSRRRATRTTVSRSSSTTELVATGDTLFRDAVGGGDVAAVRRSVMDVLLELPDTTRVLPGHADETTIGRERAREPVRARLERRGGGGHASGCASAGATRRSSSGRPTTTATARRGCASTTVTRRSSAARASNAAEPGHV